MTEPDKLRELLRRKEEECRVARLYDLDTIQKKYDCSSAPHTEWERRMKNALTEAGNLLLYAHVCAKSSGDMDAAGETEWLLDEVVKANKKLAEAK